MLSQTRSCAVVTRSSERGSLKPQKLLADQRSELIRLKLPEYLVCHWVAGQISDTKVQAAPKRMAYTQTDEVDSLGE